MRAPFHGGIPPRRGGIRFGLAASARFLRVFALGVLGACLLVLLAPGCGRTGLEGELLEAEPREGGAPPAGCGPSTCPDGCCDATGACRTGRDTRACGAAGAQCSDCVADGFSLCTSTRACAREEPACGPETCDGCCAVEDGELRCLSGTQAAACGGGGAECVSCAAQGRACDASTRSCGDAACGPDTCDGCCAGDVCLPGDLASACGSKGEACQPCAAGQTCEGVPGGGGTCEGAAACGPETCAGCCDGDHCVVVTTKDACGANGEACKACGPNQVCNPAGKCVGAPSVCNPSNCAGCCVGHVCVAGDQDTACGKGGKACTSCAGQHPPLVCISGSCEPPPCGPATCPTGCCRGDTCVLGIANDACGAGGGACADCTQTGSFCNGLVAPRRCNDQQTTCPAPYGVCSWGTELPVTTPLQKLCTDAGLDTLESACDSGADSPACAAAVAALPNACRGCLEPFHRPFEERAGLYACAASFVSSPCRRALGCAVDCADRSCESCEPTSEGQCYSLVNGSGGQCRLYAFGAACANAALSAGNLCSPVSYLHYGQWLRTVGDYFCGNGLL